MTVKNSQDLQICLRSPRLGTLSFFLILMMAIPAYLISSGKYDTLKFYLPFVVMLASTLTSSGYPDTFQDLYPLYPTTVIGFISANLINLVALIGILWVSIGTANKIGQIEVGIVIGVIMAIITFPVSTQAIPFFIREGDEFMNKHTNLKYPYHWNRYFLGFLMIGFLLSIESVLIDILLSGGFDI